MDKTLPYLSAIAEIVVAAGVILVWMQLKLLKIQIKEDHERSRKHTLIKILSEWNREIGPATAGAQKLVALLSEEECRKVFNIRPVSLAISCLPFAMAAFEGKLKSKECEDMKSIDLNSEQVAHLRFLAIEYLNILEISLSAWKLGIVDVEYMEEQFSYLLDTSRTNSTLSNFRAVMGVRDAFPSISAFLQHVNNSKTKPSAPDKPLGTN